MFKTSFKALGAVMIAIFALFITSYLITYFNSVIYNTTVDDVGAPNPINIIGLVLIIMAVKFPGIAASFRPSKTETKASILLIIILIIIFVFFSLFAGSLFKVILEEIVPKVSRILYKEIGLGESLFLILVFNLVKDQFD